MIPEPVVIAFFTTMGAIAAAVGAIYTTKRTAAQAEKASQHDQAVETDRIGLEGLRELAEQNRKDREEMRRDRAEDRKRIEHLEDEMAGLRRKVTDLELEREHDKKEIARLTGEKHSLVRYIRRLREFIAGLGQVPPEPDQPLALD